jgi:hypothetical protein
MKAFEGVVDQLPPPDVEVVLRIVEEVAPIEPRQHQVDLVEDVVRGLVREMNHVGVVNDERVLREVAGVLEEQPPILGARGRDVANPIGDQEQHAVGADELLGVGRDSKLERGELLWSHLSEPAASCSEVRTMRW